MPEYIDREKIRLEVCSNCTRHVSLVCQNPEPCYKLLAAFLEAKPVDVAPVVHGKWIFNDDWWEFRCTNCHRPIRNIKKYNYCPSCGAKMDGGEKPNE